MSILKCSNLEFFKENRKLVQELKYFCLTNKIQTIIINILTKVKGIVAFYE